MIIIPYIPNIDRSSEYVQLLAEKLGQRSELQVVTHTSFHPMEMEHCQVYYVHKNIWGTMKQELTTLLDNIKLDIVHVHGAGILNVLGYKNGHKQKDIK